MSATAATTASRVFDKNDPALGKPCSNPAGEKGKCGFLAETWISGNTETLPVMPGTAVSMNFSKDKAQSCLYVGDNTNQTIYIVGRARLEELGGWAAMAAWRGSSTGCTR